MRMGALPVISAIIQKLNTGKECFSPPAYGKLGKGKAFLCRASGRDWMMLEYGLGVTVFIILYVLLALIVMWPMLLCLSISWSIPGLILAVIAEALWVWFVVGNLPEEVNAHLLKSGIGKYPIR
jgi:hypothetical protein